MKIAVTGITGFIGRTLALKLAEQGHDVSGLVHSPEKSRLLGNNIKKLYGDIRDTAALTKLFQGCDLVYHCAAIVNGGGRAMMDVNAGGTGAVCNAVRQSKIKRMVYLSSIAVISGNDGPYPLKEELPYSAYNDYGSSKIEAEKVVRSYMKDGPDIAIIRPSAVYGPGEPHVLSGLLKLSDRGILPIAGNGLVKWQLIHIDDLTDFLVSIIDNDRAYNDIFNVSSDEALEMVDLYRLIKKITRKGVIIRIPLWLILPVAMIADTPFLFSGKKPFTNKVKFFERHHTYDTSKAKGILGLKTRISLEQGLAQIYACRKNPSSL
jgi:nucleoside-diphosphate-sugar epimerase